eukprot:scaffold20256_cov18-Tisochrysis_lutea.AAC.1
MMPFSKRQVHFEAMSSGLRRFKQCLNECCPGAQDQDWQGEVADAYANVKWFTGRSPALLHVNSTCPCDSCGPRQLHSNWGLHSSGAALHGWTKDPAHHHLTAPPTLRDGGGAAPLYTVVLPGAKVRMGDHHAAALQ